MSEIQILRQFDRSQVQLLLALFLAGFSKTKLSSRLNEEQYSSVIHEKITALLADMQTKMLDYIQNRWQEESFDEFRSDLRRAVENGSAVDPDVFSCIQVLQIVRESVLQDRSMGILRVLTDVFSVYDEVNFASPGRDIRGREVASELQAWGNSPGHPLVMSDRVAAECRELIEELFAIYWQGDPVEVMAEPELTIFACLTKLELQLAIAIFLCGFRKTELTRFILHGDYRRSTHARITSMLSALQEKIAILIDELWEEEWYDAMYFALRELVESAITVTQ